MAKTTSSGLDLGTAQQLKKRQGILAQRDPHVIVNLARKETIPALKRLVDLMNGKSGQKMTVVTKEGATVEVDVPVPPAVMLRAAEIVIERGYGKAPQAILVKADDPLQGEHAVPIMERIAMLRASMDQNDNTVDLEASQQGEVTTEDPPIEIPVLPPAPEDARSAPERDARPADADKI